MTPIERAVCDDLAARGPSMLADLAEHVAVPTGREFAPGLTKYRELLVRRLEALGATIERLPPAPRPKWLDSGHGSNEAAGTSTNAPAADEIVVARRVSGDLKAPRILIACHIDTVHDPQGPFQRLTTLPGGSKAVGPGAADMKGGIVIVLAALDAIARAVIAMNWTVILNCDEETGSFQSAEVLRTEARRHDFGIAPEPALPGGALASERLGSGQFMIEVTGKAAHVGRDFTSGISAVTKLGEILVALARLADPARGLIVNVGPLRGGPATNIVPDRAACWGNVRFRDQQGADTLARSLAAFATPPAGPLPRVAVHTAWNRPAKPMIEETRQMIDVATTCAADLGQVLPLATTGGVCDGNLLQDAGLPTIDTLGVRGGGLHTTDEWIEVPSLVQRCQLLALVLTRLGRRSIARDA